MNSSPQYIAHRVNDLESLSQVPQELGVELDLRDRGERLILQHDPFTDGMDFEDFLPHYHHGTLILNIKSERIEYRVLELLRRFKIEDYFFLDSSLPMIMTLCKEGEHRIAVRYSEVEPLESVLVHQGQVEWVWVDCFTRLPMDHQVFQRLKQAGFKLCLVSPELQGQPEKIEAYKHQLAEQQIVFDAICTKLYNIPRWQAA